MWSRFIAKGVKDYVMDNCGCTDSLMASRFYRFLRRFVNPPAVGDSTYFNYHAADARQKNLLTNAYQSEQFKFYLE